MENKVVLTDSQTLRVECDGLVVEGRYLPQFRLKRGESLCLHVQHSPYPWYDGLLAALTGQVPYEEVRLHGSVAYLRRPMPGRGWFGRRKDFTAHHWLASEKNLSS